MTKRVTESPTKMAERMKKKSETPEEKAKRILREERKGAKRSSVREESGAVRKRYRARKLLVKTMEESNYSKIIAFATYGETGFWKLIGHSAIYYAYHEAKRLKKDVELIRDTDFFGKDKNGFVAIPDIDRFGKSLEKLGVELTKEMDDPYIRVFDTGVKFSDADLKNMLRRKELLTEQINRMLVPEVSDPELYKTLRQILEKVCKCHKTTDPTMKQATYELLVAPAFHAHGSYILMARGKKSLRKAKLDMVTDLEKMVAGLAGFQTVNELGITQIWELSDLVQKAETLVLTLGNKGNGNGIK